jgi:Fe-S-cluster-containing hydrogenase component 2/thioredoxin reductase/CRP-like cAMP-binding protein
VSEVKLAIVGSGPAGLSAAATAAALGVDHVLLEAESEPCDTVFKYSKGKPVMAEPSRLPLRAHLPFAAGTREQIRDGWLDACKKAGVKPLLNHKVTRVRRDGDRFTLTINNDDGSPITATHVVLATGESIPNRLDDPPRPGSNPVKVDSQAKLQYQLDDPAEFQGESVLVIGAGDAGIENALALAKFASVKLIVKRADVEFPRAKDGNRNLVKAAFESGSVAPVVGETAEVRRRGILLDTGEPIRCDRVIARIGGGRDIKLLKACEIPLKDNLPILDERFQTRIPGLYVIGSLGGVSSLIKEALNQGHDVVHHILEKKIRPADEELLEKIVKPVRGADVDTMLGRLKNELRLFADLTSLQLRDALLDSELVNVEPGAIIFKHGSFGDHLFHVLDGEVTLTAPDDPQLTIGPGEFFGESALLAGRPYSATATAARTSLILQTARRTVFKMQKAPAAKEHLESTIIRRQLQRLVPSMNGDDRLMAITKTAEPAAFRRNEILYGEGQPGVSLYVINSGTVAISRMDGGRKVVLRYAPAGEMIGAVVLFRPDHCHTTTATAVTAVEVTRLEVAELQTIIESDIEVSKRTGRRASEEVSKLAQAYGEDLDETIADSLMANNYAEGVNVLLIDEAICVGCDNCEKACAATHADGISRLTRKLGPTSASVRAPISCLHCEHPLCMTDCPPNVIHRQPSGEVVIDDMGCIGCGNCQRNCPFGVIQMAAPADRQPSLLMRMLFGDSGRKTGKSESSKKVAVKCDLCSGSLEGPACVHACPTGAAIRMPAKDFAISSRR